MNYYKTILKDCTLPALITRDQKKKRGRA